MQSNSTEPWRKYAERRYDAWSDKSPTNREWQSRMEQSKIEEMIRLYVKEEMSTNKIANKFAVIPATVRYHLINNGVEMRKDKGKIRSRSDFEPLVKQTKRDLKAGATPAELYDKKGLSPTILAEAMGEERQKVVDGQLRNQIKMRSSSKVEIPDYVIPRLEGSKSFFSVWRDTVSDHGIEYGTFVAAAKRLGYEPTGKDCKAAIPMPSAQAVLAAYDQHGTHSGTAAAFDVSVRTYKRWLEKFTKKELTAARKALGGNIKNPYSTSK